MFEDSISQARSSIHGVENIGLELDDKDTYGMGENLYVEVSKLRDFRKDNDSPASKRRRSVHSDFATENLAVKIYKEEQRRASVAPFKKTYTLDDYYDSD